MVFVDASAMIAMITGEEDAGDLADRLENGRPARLCSAMSVWQTIAGLCRNKAFSVALARSTVRSFLSDHEFQLVNIGEAELEAASVAHARFGKGCHPAALNMGDCFAYACAKTNRASLLFKGGDFGKTDIDQAM